MTHLLLAVIYLAFISLGLPDAVLGAGWPVMYKDLHAGLGYAGIVSTIISVSTVISSLNSDRMTRRFGAGRVTAVSAAVTALSLFGFSAAPRFWVLCVLAVPYGLGAGGVDAAVNNYAAVHYENRHMSWLHCMWGIGAAAGPYIMGWALTDRTWRAGYLTVGALQVVLTALLFLSLPLWQKRPDAGESASGGSLAPPDVLRLPGAIPFIATFFCYCALESTAGLWAASYLALGRGVGEQTAAGWASLFYIGITAGRFLNGFLTMKLSDARLVSLGAVISAAGAAVLLFIPGDAFAVAGLILVGLGCAPVYPCLIHATPAYFGADKSQAVIGVQMAAAYCGTALIPPLFGLLASHVDVRLYPPFLLALAALMFALHRLVARRSGQGDRPHP